MMIYLFFWIKEGSKLQIRKLVWKKNNFRLTEQSAKGYLTIQMVLWHTCRCGQCGGEFCQVRVLAQIRLLVGL